MVLISQLHVTYGLAADFENLTLTGVANINGAGNAPDNLGIGNATATICPDLPATTR